MTRGPVRRGGRGRDGGEPEFPGGWGGHLQGTSRLPKGPVSWGLRAVVVGAGVVALGLTWQVGLVAVAVVLGAAGLFFAALDPGGPGPAGLLAAVALGWLLRYGTDPAPAVRTVLIAAALAVHHQAAALSAVVPPGARVDRTVLLRHGGNLLLLLALSAPVAVVALALSRPGGSVPLEFLGLAAATATIAVPVTLSRTLRR